MQDPVVSFCVDERVLLWVLSTALAGEAITPTSANAGVVPRLIFTKTKLG